MWIHALYDLTEIELPPYTDSCYGIGDDAVGDFACDFPDEWLYNIARVGFKDENPKAFAFFKNMQLTTDQQQKLLLMIDVQGMDVDVAVRQ